MTSWEALHDYIKNNHPESLLACHLVMEEVTSEIICPFNGKTFPSKGIWMDEKGRKWLMAGMPGVWDVKLPSDAAVYFPDVYSKIVLRLQAKKKTFAIEVEVKSMFAQTSAVFEKQYSSICARSRLHLIKRV